ncbi:hypothetical protein [Pseudomonas syringae]|uniref:hypothetical protein n=1 Tax=Pseudomonas syringae TaxID=317 RepID=UPI003204F76B
MKKISEDNKIRARRNEWNAIWRIKRPRNRIKRDRSSRTSIFSAPVKFDIFNEKRNDLINFIEDIRNSVKNGCRSVLIDFSKTNKFISGGAIIFYAEMDRLLDVYPKLSIRCSIPLNQKASLVLQQIGFYKRINKPFKKSACNHDDISNWRVAKGHGVLGEQYDVILGHYDGVITPALQGELYAGLTEAMTNAHHHAYISRRSDGIITPKNYKPWWMFSQEKDGVLSVVFCDLGVGIPKSLPFSDDDGWRKWYLVLSRFGMQNLGDARLIRGAIRHSKTRTRLHNRGKGLTQIVETVNATDGGTAIILSNSGWYQIRGGEETYDDYPRSIHGTIISWQMPLGERSES